jgi:hypothetical protein
MENIKSYQAFNESLSNYTLDTWPNGEYDGIIKGYDVYSDDVDSGFKTTSGLKNASPIRCKIYVKNGSATVYHKDGILFSDDKTRDNWKSKYGSLNNDPIFSQLNF